MMTASAAAEESDGKRLLGPVNGEVAPTAPDDAPSASLSASIRRRSHAQLPW